ncbi:MAG: tannase/feruloyl esterase family alpha/beta hydrolase [Acetobacteraceae bacterium]
MLRGVLPVVAGSLTLGFAGSPALAATCSVAALNALAIQHVSVTAASDMPAADGNPAYCDVRGSIDTGGNAAGFRIQLPATWNHKLLVYGVGGTGGSVETPSPNAVDRAQSLVQGYATAVTDTGHQNQSNADASFALHPDGTPNLPALNDYLYRAAHALTVAAKRLAPAYYAATPVEQTYFDGCSNGGRMALIGGERYPLDYDGIIAGAPAISQLRILALLKGAKSQLAPDERVTPEQLPMIDAAFQASCDAADGVRDGVVQNPARCAFKPADLLCKPGQSSQCLTPGQVRGLESYLAPMKDQHGKVLLPGFLLANVGPGPLNFAQYASGPNAPPDPAAAEPWGTAPPARGWALSDTTLKFIVYRDVTYNTQSFPLGANGVIDDAALHRYRAATKDGDADDPAALDGFIRANRKLIVYHGFGDHALSPMQTISFYERLAARAGGNYATLARNVRLFMVPGMQHCGREPGINSFDTLSALDAWVTRGVAPKALVATDYVDKANPGAGVKRTMPLCPFPAQAHYNGSGDVNAAANWSCPAGDRSLLAVGPVGVAAGMRSAAK